MTRPREYQQVMEYRFAITTWTKSNYSLSLRPMHMSLLLYRTILASSDLGITCDRQEFGSREREKVFFD